MRLIELMDDLGMVKSLPPDGTSVKHEKVPSAAGPLDSTIFLAPVVACRSRIGSRDGRQDMLCATVWSQYGLLGLLCWKGKAELIPLADAEAEICGAVRNRSSTVYRDDAAAALARNILTALPHPSDDVILSEVRYENNGRTFAGRIGFDADNYWVRFDDGTLWNSIPRRPVLLEPDKPEPKVAFALPIDAVMCILRDDQDMRLPYNTFAEDRSAHGESASLGARLDKESEYERLLRPIADAMRPLLAPGDADCRLVVCCIGEPSKFNEIGKKEGTGGMMFTSFSRFKNGNWRTMNFTSSTHSSFGRRMPYDPQLYHDACDRASRRVELWTEGTTEDQKDITREELEKWKFIEQL